MNSLTLHHKTATKKDTQDKMKLNSKTNSHNKHTQMYNTVNKAAGWAGTEVQVCRALVMANNKSGFFLTAFIGMRFGFA